MGGRGAVREEDCGRKELTGLLTTSLATPVSVVICTVIILPPTNQFFVTIAASLPIFAGGFKSKSLKVNLCNISIHAWLCSSTVLLSACKTSPLVIQDTYFGRSLSLNDKNHVVNTL